MILPVPDFSQVARGLLKKPGDKLSAEVTKSGKQVVKISTSEMKRSAVRYLKTGTVVETIVHKNKK